jgi:Flp pilus assembly protein CpaB
MLLFYLAYVYSRSYQHNACGGWYDPETSVVVARHELLPGHTIQPEDLVSTETWWTVADDRALRNPEQAVGRVPVERILPGELIREERLAEPEAGVGMTAVFPRGASPVEVPLGASLARPGDSVDVLLTRRHTETLLEDQQILAIEGDQALLGLPRPQAQQVQQALEGGVATLVLRPSPHTAHGPRPTPPHHSVPVSQMRR